MKGFLIEVNPGKGNNVWVRSRRGEKKCLWRRRKRRRRRRTSCGIEVSPVPWEGQRAGFHSSKGRMEGGEEMGEEVRKSSILNWQGQKILNSHSQKIQGMKYLDSTNCATEASLQDQPVLEISFRNPWDSQESPPIPSETFLAPLKSVTSRVASSSSTFCISHTHKRTHQKHGPQNQDRLNHYHLPHFHHLEDDVGSLPS